MFPILIYNMFFHCELICLQIPKFFSFQLVFIWNTMLIPQLVLNINNHSPPLIYQRWIAPINVVCAAKLFIMEDEWNVLGYNYKQREAQTKP